MTAPDTPRVVPASATPLADLVTLAETIAEQAHAAFKQAGERYGLVLAEEIEDARTHLSDRTFNLTICGVEAYEYLWIKDAPLPCRECAAAVDARDADERRAL